MRLWPRRKRTERRAEAGGFTKAVTEALMARARGAGDTSTAEATAALEAAAGVFGRAFAVANVSPRTPATAALDPGAAESRGARSDPPR